MRRFFVLFILIVFCFCNQEKPVSKYFEDNLEVIKYQNPESWALKFELQLEEVLTISGYQNNEFIPFGELMNFMVDNENNIYIVERHTSQVHKFSKNGAYLKSFGRKGQGPSESNAPAAIFEYENYLYLLSQSPQKLIKFDRDLNFVNSIKLPPRSVLVILRNQQNKPQFFLTLDRAKIEGGSDWDFQWVRSYHTFNFPKFERDTLASVFSPRSGEIKDGVSLVSQRLIFCHVVTYYIIDCYKPKFAVIDLNSNIHNILILVQA